MVTRRRNSRNVTSGLLSASKADDRRTIKSADFIVRLSSASVIGFGSDLGITRAPFTRFWATCYKHWIRVTSQYLLCSTCRQRSTRSIMRSYCGVWRCHTAWDAPCWAGSPRTSVAVHSMSAVVGQCRTSWKSFALFRSVHWADTVLAVGLHCGSCTCTCTCDVVDEKRSFKCPHRRSNRPVAS